MVSPEKFVVWQKQPQDLKYISAKACVKEVRGNRFLFIQQLHCGSNRGKAISQFCIERGGRKRYQCNIPADGAIINKPVFGNDYIQRGKEGKFLFKWQQEAI